MTISYNVFLWTTPSGQEIQVRVADYCGRARLSAWIDGRPESDSRLTVLDKALTQGLRPVTHRIGRVGLTAEEVALIEASVAKLQAELDARPENQLRCLIDQRERLADHIAAALDETEARRERAFERDMGGVPSYDSPEYRAAVSALAEFDTRHPEAVESLQAERAAGAARCD